MVLLHLEGTKVAGDFDDWEEFESDEDIEEDDDELLPGEQSTFRDPGIEDEEVPEEEAIWELPDDPPETDSEEYDEHPHRAGPDE